MVRLLASSIVVALGCFFIWNDSASAQEKKTDVKVGEEPLPPRALNRFGTSKFRHGSRILCLAYSPTGRQIVAGGGDDPIRVWDSDTGILQRALPEAWVNAMVFSTRGTVVITAGAFKTIRMWETTTGKEVNKLEGHKSPVKALALSPDGTLLASGDAEGNVIIWELLVARIVTTFKGHTDEITALAFSPDSSILASGSGDRTLRLWDVDNGKFLRQADAGCLVGALAFIEPRVLASGGDDNLIRIWNVDTAKQTDSWKGHEGNVVSMQVIHEKKTKEALALVSGAHDGTIRLWDLPRKGEPKILHRSLGDSDALAVTRGGDFIASGGVNNTIRIFETASLKELSFGLGHQAGIHALALAPNGKSLVSASVMGDFLAWGPSTGKINAAWKGPKGGEVILAFTPDSGTLASAAGTDDIRLWNPADGKEKLTLPGTPGDPILSLGFSADAQHLLVGHRSGKVAFWNLKDKKSTQELKYAGPAYTLAVSKDGKTLAVSGGSKVTIWGLEGFKELKTFGTRAEGPETTWPVVATLAFHPDGNQVALSCYDGVIRLMDITTGKEIKACEGHTSVAYGLAFSGDGRSLATASFDRTVRLWEAFSGQQIAQFKGHQGPGTAVAFSRDGRTFFSGSADTTIFHWDAIGSGGTVPAVKLSVPEMQEMWLALASEETAKAHGTLWRFVGGGKDSVNFMEGNLYLVNPKHIDKLFEDLKSEVYKTRELATAELEKYGRWMEDRLVDASKLENTLEVQRRLERLLSKLSTSGSLSMNQERLRVRRAMMIMEQLGDENAVRVLEKLANGAPTPALQQEAQGSVNRLKAMAAK